MQHQPPPSPDDRDRLRVPQQPSPPSNSPSNQHLIYHTPPSHPSIAPMTDEAKDPTGLWSIGGSTNVSFAIGDTQNSSSLLTTLTRHFQSDIDPRHTDLLLMVCGFVSGLVDGLSFNAWGSFSSMQTGNTIFLALGATGQPLSSPPYLWAKSLIALAVYMLSNALFISVSRLLKPLRRSTLILSFAVQTAALLVAALLVQLHAVRSTPEDPNAPIEWLQVLPIALLAFQAGGQIVASRVLSFDEIPTVVVTAMLADLVVDPRVLAGVTKNAKRNRRVGAFLALFFGAMVAGALCGFAEEGMAGCLWLAFGLKGVVTLVWGVWRGKKRVGEGEC